MWLWTHSDFQPNFCGSSYGLLLWKDNFFWVFVARDNNSLEIDSHNWWQSEDPRRVNTNIESVTWQPVVTGERVNSSSKDGITDNSEEIRIFGLWSEKNHRNVRKFSGSPFISLDHQQPSISNNKHTSQRSGSAVFPWQLISFIGLGRSGQMKFSTRPATLHLGPLDSCIYDYLCAVFLDFEHRTNFLHRTLGCEPKINNNGASFFSVSTFDKHTSLVVYFFQLFFRCCCWCFVVKDERKFIGTCWVHNRFSVLEQIV